MVAIQLDFFKTDEQCEIDALRHEVRDVKASGDRVRKKLFAENNKLNKSILDLEERISIMEKGICNGKYYK